MTALLSFRPCAPAGPARGLYGAVVALLVASLACAADPTSVHQREALRAAPGTHADVTRTLDAGTAVEVLDTRGGWARVRADGYEGWVRILSLRRPPPSLSRPTGDGKVVAVLGVRGVETSGNPAAHALIMTIGRYQGGIPPLAGTAMDAQNAPTIARAMGVPEANITTISDAALTAEGIGKALDEFAKIVAPDDEAFVYYSGHGSRVRTRDGRCAEALVGVDGTLFTDTDLAVRLHDLGSRAKKVVAFLDASHSGGSTTRDAAPRFTPKYWAREDVEKCAHPVDRFARDLVIARTVPYSGAGNYVYIAAARADEIALDEPAKGGLATQAWLSCVRRGSTDGDASGALNADEIARCAQPVIESALAGAQGYAPHHVTITGNGAMPLALNPEPTGTPAPSTALAALNDIYAARDDRREVRLETDRASLQIGREPLELRVTSLRAGYVYLLMVGSDGRTFDLLFPNALDPDNAIRAGETLTLPRPHWAIKARGPAGKSHVLAVVADSPRDFSAAGLKPSGPFSVAIATGVTAKDMVLVTGVAAQSLTPDCQDARIRTLTVEPRCSNAYGAALLTVVEVK